MRAYQAVWHAEANICVLCVLSCNTAVWKHESPGSVTCCVLAYALPIEVSSLLHKEPYMRPCLAVEPNDPLSVSTVRQVVYTLPLC